MEDWDQRLLVTTLERGEEGGGLVLLQEAEKDQVREKYVMVVHSPQEASLRQENREFVKVKKNSLSLLIII